jgi:hypothetical protein
MAEEESVSQIPGTSEEPSSSPWSKQRNGHRMTLVSVLADLYPSEVSAVRVVEDAQIEPKRIDFSGSAVNRWTNILREARQTRKLVSIMEVTLREYGDNLELVQAWNRDLADRRLSVIEGTKSTYVDRASEPVELLLLDYVASNRLNQDAIYARLSSLTDRVDLAVTGLRKTAWENRWAIIVIGIVLLLLGILMFDHVFQISLR